MKDLNLALENILHVQKISACCFLQQGWTWCCQSESKSRHCHFLFLVKKKRHPTSVGWLSRNSETILWVMLSQDAWRFRRLCLPTKRVFLREMTSLNKHESKDKLVRLLSVVLYGSQVWTQPPSVHLCIFLGRGTLGCHCPPMKQSAGFNGRM